MVSMGLSCGVYEGRNSSAMLSPADSTYSRIVFDLWQEVMRPRTCSQNIVARIFCFLYAVIMFNAWVLANAMLADCSNQADATITQASFKFMVEITLLLSSIIPPESPPDPDAP